MAVISTKVVQDTKAELIRKVALDPKSWAGWAKDASEDLNLANSLVEVMTAAQMRIISALCVWEQQQQQHKRVA